MAPSPQVSNRTHYQSHDGAGWACRAPYREGDATTSVPDRVTCLRCRKQLLRWFELGKMVGWDEETVEGLKRLWARGRAARYETYSPESSVKNRSAGLGTPQINDLLDDVTTQARVLLKPGGPLARFVAAENQVKEAWKYEGDMYSPAHAAVSLIQRKAGEILKAAQVILREYDHVDAELSLQEAAGRVAARHVAGPRQEAQRRWEALVSEAAQTAARWMSEEPTPARSFDDALWGVAERAFTLHEKEFAALYDRVGEDAMRAINAIAEAVEERPARRRSAATPKCVVCGAEGEEIRYTVKGKSGTALAGRVFVKGTVLCEEHQEMCDNP